MLFLIGWEFLNLYDSSFRNSKYRVSNKDDFEKSIEKWLSSILYFFPIKTGSKKLRSM